MDKHNCLYFHYYKSSGILFELKVIRATYRLIIYSTLALSSFPKLSLGLRDGFLFEIRYFIFSFFLFFHYLE